MKVAELIDILNDLDPDAVIQMVIATPVDDDDETLTVELYGIDGVLPRRPDDEDGESVVWLIGGDEEDVEELIDAIDADDETIAPAGEVVELVWDRD
jgi:hypothetical protein